MIDNVILVDSDDNQVGLMEKMQAHFSGQLHRAFSVFIFNSKGELLLQQRAVDKYHSGGKWTNTCCSHPREHEHTTVAAHRRLLEEMGMVCHLEYGFNFMYKAEVTAGIIEHEFDHVYFGISDNRPNFAPQEVAGFRYIGMNELAKDIKVHPELYTEWLKICLEKVMKYYTQMLKDGRIG
ncbi:isopentenyl-diphosphate Delta-isomerase [Pedobacter polaris]|uniref:Isopentenyl-diphosphate delta-isomerase n=1 Tax=Pedobacter polaris TaxID=2571273 RepID=A0A4U1CW69_9SPHI|nr:isopentenyl-diphosphate Delta-isomerase [Pedobacter polaris]TKC10509.1 isopentenyl-diphosphate Delta-isomerase [Pedobacter polaris]